jgi:single-strand DNA-binding protein
MANLFSVTLIGRLPQDLNLEYSDTSEPYVLTSLAMNRKTKDDEQSLYADLKFYGKTAERAANNLQTGDEVLVTGNAWIREFERRDGTTDKVLTVAVSTLEIIKCRKWNESNGGSNGRGNGSTNGRPAGNGNGNRQYDDNAPANRGNGARPNQRPARPAPNRYGGGQRQRV